MTEPTRMPEKAFPVSWDAFHRDARALAWRLHAAGPFDAIVARLAASGFVDDRAFAAARGAGLSRRGYGARRVSEALRAAGIDADDAAPALEEAGEAAWASAEAFAKRRRIGPFSARPGDPEARRKAFAAMLRAGHPPRIAQAFAHAEPGSMPAPPN